MKYTGRIGFPIPQRSYFLSGLKPVHCTGTFPPKYPPQFDDCLCMSHIIHILYIYFALSMRFFKFCEFFNSNINKQLNVHSGFLRKRVRLGAIFFSYSVTIHLLQANGEVYPLHGHFFRKFSSFRKFISFGH